MEVNITNPCKDDVRVLLLRVVRVDDRKVPTGQKWNLLRCRVLGLVLDVLSEPHRDGLWGSGPFDICAHVHMHVPALVFSN